MKNGFISVSLLPFTKKLGRSSNDVIMRHYDVTLKFTLLRFIANGG